MNSSKLEEKILELRPNYSEKYRSMIETISNKGEKTGTGNIAKFGPIYQTFMYACIIGLRLGKPKYFAPQENIAEFALMLKWKPTPIRDYIIMMMLNRSGSFGYNWIDLENADDETISKFLRAFCREMEGYANAGFEYLHNLWDSDQRVLFQSPTVFVDILTDLDKQYYE